MRAIFVLFFDFILMAMFVALTTIEPESFWSWLGFFTFQGGLFWQPRTKMCIKAGEPRRARVRHTGVIGHAAHWRNIW